MTSFQQVQLGRSKLYVHNKCYFQFTMIKIKSVSKQKSVAFLLGVKLRMRKTLSQRQLISL